MPSRDGNKVCLGQWEEHILQGARKGLVQAFPDPDLFPPTGSRGHLPDLYQGHCPAKAALTSCLRGQTRLMYEIGSVLSTRTFFIRIYCNTKKY